MTTVSELPELPSGSQTPNTGEEVTLAAMSRVMAALLADGRPKETATLANVVLKQLPRHLASYEKLLEATWQLRAWSEGEELGRRLLQADPCSPLAWRSVARGVEERGERGQARAIWLRAFEASPYNADIRAGLARTSLNVAEDLSLNQACLATLYRRGYRWQFAVSEYRALVESDRHRADFLAGLMVSLWRLGARQDAYRAARHLADRHPYILMAWLVIAATGDENDRALGHNPIRSMDPDGEYARRWLRLEQAPSSEKGITRLLPSGNLSIPVTADEAMLVKQNQPTTTQPNR